MSVKASSFNQMEYWVMAIRPKTLPAGLAPILLGISLAAIRTPLNIPLALVIIITALLLQIASNLANDYFDFKDGIDSPDRLGPSRVCAQGLIPPLHIRNGFFICIGIALILSFVLALASSYLTLLMLSLCTFMAYAYSSGPFPLSKKGLGEVAAFIFFGPIAVGLTYFILTKEISFKAILLGVGPGFISGALMGLNNLRDRVTDEKCNKITFAVKYGEHKAKALILFFYLMAISVPFILNYFEQKQFSSLAVLSALPFLKSWLKLLNQKVDSSLNNNLEATGKFLLYYSVLFSIGIHL